MIARVPLDPMDRKDIREAVDGPARSNELRHLRLTVDPELPRLIAHHLLSNPEARDAIAPTLQVILSQFWDQVKDENPRHYSEDLYNKLKGKGLLLREFLLGQIGKLETTHPTELENGFHLEVLKAHTTAWGTANRRSRRSLVDQFPEQAERLPGLLQRLKDLYLLIEPPAEPQAVKDLRADSDPETSLAHDALVRLVQEMQLASSASAQRAHRLLKNRAGEWKENKTRTPLDPDDLKIVQAGLPWIRKLEEHERKLMDASLVAERSRIADRRFQVRVRQTLVAIAGTLFVSAVAAAVAFMRANGQLDEQVTKTNKANEELQKQSKATNELNEKLGTTLESLTAQKKLADKATIEAQREAKLASSQRLATLSRAAQGTNSSVALLLAAEAVKRTEVGPGQPPIYVAEAEQALRDALRSFSGRPLPGDGFGGGPSLQPNDVSPDGRWFGRLAHEPYGRCAEEPCPPRTIPSCSGPPTRSQALNGSPIRPRSRRPR